MKTSIYVVSHKNSEVPSEGIYQPIQVGDNKDTFDKFIRDNSGDNIASKNKNYCELTAQYWGWKNDDSDIKGLVHYRRYFSNGKNHFFSSKEKKFSDILNKETLTELMNQSDMILPKKRHYYIETSWSHYEHAHHIEGLNATRTVIQNKYPEYLETFDQVMKRRSAHMFNMIIAKRNIFDSYSNWLFDILAEVEKSVDISNYSASEARIFGYISELLLDVWVDKNNIKYTEVPVMFMERQNWIKKGFSFIKRKFVRNK